MLERIRDFLARVWSPTSVRSLAPGVRQFPRSAPPEPRYNSHRQTHHLARHPDPNASSTRPTSALTPQRLHVFFARPANPWLIRTPPPSIGKVVAGSSDSAKLAEFRAQGALVVPRSTARAGHVHQEVHRREG